MIIFIDKKTNLQSCFKNAVSFVGNINFIINGKKRTVNTARRLLKKGIFENEDYILFRTTLNNDLSFDFTNIKCTFEEIKP